MTQNMRNAGDPELMDGEEMPNSGHLLQCNLHWKNLFSFNNSLEAEFSLPGAVSHPRGDRPTSAAVEGWEEGATAARDWEYCVLGERGG